jgi:hypothetical protein
MCVLQIIKKILIIKVEALNDLDMGFKIINMKIKGL